MGVNMARLSNCRLSVGLVGNAFMRSAPTIVNIHGTDKSVPYAQFEKLSDKLQFSLAFFIVIC